MSIFSLIAIGLFAGTMSGILGLGGGVFLVPLLNLSGLAQPTAQGTSLALLSLPVAAAAAYAYFKAGKVKLYLLPWLFFSFVIGSYLGATEALALSAKTLEKVFGIFLIALGLKTLLKPKHK
jgi:uncharacterized membrane protein YfcA